MKSNKCEGCWGSQKFYRTRPSWEDVDLWPWGEPMSCSRESLGPPWPESWLSIFRNAPWV
eukprot:1151919-Pelagomonas_calceolata.AAC.1